MTLANRVCFKMKFQLHVLVWRSAHTRPCCRMIETMLMAFARRSSPSWPSSRIPSSMKKVRPHGKLCHHYHSRLAIIVKKVIALRNLGVVYANKRCNNLGLISFITHMYMRKFTNFMQIFSPVLET